MEFQPEVNIPSETGLFRLTYDDVVRFDHPSLQGKNHKNLVLLGMAWFSLIGDSPFDKRKPRIVLRDFYRSFFSDPYAHIARYAVLADKLLRAIEYKDGILIIGDFLPEFKDTPVFREYLEFRKTHDAGLLRYVLTFLVFGKKTGFDRPELGDTSLRGWLQVEERLSRVALPPVIINLKRLCKLAFADFRAGVFLPKHGSGAVAERGLKGLDAKNSSMKLDPKIAYTYRLGVMGEGEFDVFQIDSNVTRQVVGMRSSRLKFVLKNYKTYRSICMEPADFQWAQQGVRVWLEDFISESGWFRRHINFRDQGLNQRYARLGSLSGLVDTIDLAAASDSVLWDLIKFIFPPQVLRHLMATRTDRVELPDGSIHIVNKYAPMGSALCFPIQSVLYSLVCLLETIAYDAGKRSDDLSLTLLAPKFAPGVGRYQEIIPHVCYGDDIITDNRITSNVIDTLTSLGFEVNEGKSFCSAQAVRESCGIYAIAGRDITPLNCKFETLGQRMDAAFVSSAVGLANRAWDYGYLQLRKFVINTTLRLPLGLCSNKQGINPIRFSSDREDSMSFYTLRPRNNHLRRRVYNPLMPSNKGTNYLYQRAEVEAVQARPSEVEERNPSQDGYHYLCWQRSRYRRAGDATQVASSAAAYTLRTGLVLGWNPD